MKPNFAIGIDAGTKTGVAVWCMTTKSYVSIETMPIHAALELVRNYNRNSKVSVIVEDARQVRFNTSPDKAQGAGYVKAHAQIWEAFLKDHGIPHVMKRPNKAITKWSAEQFKTATKYHGKTDNHNRDAAMLVYQYQ